MLAMTCGQSQLLGTADGSFGGLDVRDQGEEGAAEARCGHSEAW